MEWYERVNAEFSCDHAQSIPVKYTKSNGVVCVRLQCRRCGESQGERKKAEYTLNELPDWDESTRERWRQLRSARYEEEREAQRQEQEATFERQRREREAAFEQRRKEYEEARAQQNADWWEGYGKYLRSQRWHTMRQKVLERDGYTCQACLASKATHVHHLSYDLYNQLGKSAAFELVAICRACHEQIHPHMSEAQDKLTYYNPYLNGATNGQHR